MICTPEEARLKVCTNPVSFKFKDGSIYERITCEGEACNAWQPCNQLAECPANSDGICYVLHHRPECLGANCTYGFCGAGRM